MQELIKIAKSVGLIPLVILGLVGLGAAINAVVPWYWLTYFFVILRHNTELVSFFIDPAVLWPLVGISLGLEAAYWTYRGVMTGVMWFRHH